MNTKPTKKVPGPIATRLKIKGPWEKAVRAVVKKASKKATGKKKPA
jgi:hypothetical protein